MNTDITWCMSADCAARCDRHITEYPISDKRELVSCADLSGVCRRYIYQRVEHAEKINTDGMMKWDDDIGGYVPLDD